VSFPQNVVSTVPVESAFLLPDSADILLFESRERGGVAVGDGTQGRQVADWLASISFDGATINIQRTDGGAVTAFVTGGVNITEVSVSFDSNMNPSCAYRENGVVKFKWYNTLTALFQTDTYIDVTSFKVSADDKRIQQSAISDVIFTYMVADVLYWRQQRDRYLVEYTAGTFPKYRIRRFGMTAVNRMQFELEKVS
jgi:hypothetical protein